MILLITNKEDVHPNPVIDLWKEWGVPFFRLNTEALLTDYSFSWWSEQNGCDFFIRCNQTQLEVFGHDITALWERRPEHPQNCLQNTPEIDRHNQQEALGFLQFLRFYLKNIPSIGSIVWDRVASSKMLQQKIALECGFQIPKTIFTNRKEDVMEFAKYLSMLAVKSIDNSNIWDDYNCVDYVFFTQVLEAKQIPSIPDEAFSQTVSFIQEYIPKQYELRVTVVGDEVFAARLDSQNEVDRKGSVDWREIDCGKLKVTTCELPLNISSQCVALVKKLNLNFGCIDLAVTPDNQFVLLECNPNGQWLWVEDKTGLGISNSIAKWLAKYESRFGQSHFTLLL